MKKLITAFVIGMIVALSGCTGGDTVIQPREEPLEYGYKVEEVGRIEWIATKEWLPIVGYPYDSGFVLVEIRAIDRTDPKNPKYVFYHCKFRGQFDYPYIKEDDRVRFRGYMEKAYDNGGGLLDYCTFVKIYDW